MEPDARPAGDGPDTPAVAPAASATRDWKRIDEVAEQPGETSGATPDAPETGWVRWGRWVMLALTITAGGAFAWDRDEYTGSEVAVGVAVGAIGMSLVVIMYGLIIWVVMRGLARKPAWTFKRSALSPLALTLALLGAAGFAAVRANSSEDDQAPVVRSVSQLTANQADPVGMKLSGRSTQISSSDRQALQDRVVLGQRWTALLGRALRDYLDQGVSGEAWAAKTAARLREADRVMASLIAITDRVSDDAVRRQLRHFDARRQAALNGYHKLLRVVTAGDAAAERPTYRAMYDKLMALRSFQRHLADLLSPYVSSKERKLLREYTGQ